MSDDARQCLECDRWFTNGDPESDLCIYCRGRLLAALAEIVAGDEGDEFVSALLSLKCKLYGQAEHTPCSGTTDDGTQRNCECWCHQGSPMRRTKMP